MLLSFPFLLLVFIALYVTRRLYRGFYHLRAFKGPPLAAYSRLWLARAYYTEKPNEIFLETNKKYGRVARIGPNHLLTDDPKIHWRVLAPHSKYTRSSWFDSLRLDPHYASIASERDPTKHDVLRSKVSAGYMTRNFPKLDSLVDLAIAQWKQRLDTHIAKRENSFDFGRNIRTFTLELAAQICYSRGFDLNEDEEEATRFWKSIEEAAPYGQYISVFNWLFRLLYFVAHIPALKKRLLLVEGNNPGIGRILKYSRITVEDRFRKGGLGVQDMLNSWLQHGLTQHEAETEASIAIVTGAFPSASAINVLLLHIATNPAVSQKLRDELDNECLNGQLSNPPTYAELVKLPYLQACVDEALRLVPPIVQLRERVVPKGGDTIDENYIPEGTIIGFNTQGILRSSCFGEQPDVFRPERWLNADELSLREMRKIHALIFGYGSTKCLGVTQASMIIYKFIFELFRCYEVQVVRPAEPWIAQCNGVFFHREFYVNMTRRTN